MAMITGDRLWACYISTTAVGDVVLPARGLWSSPSSNFSHIQQVGTVCILRYMKHSLGLFELYTRNPEEADCVVVYCHSDVRSAHTTLVLRELLGHPNVTNNDGSWIEWSHHLDLPVATVEKQQ